MDFANPVTNTAERISRGEDVRQMVYSLSIRYLVLRKLVDAGYVDVRAELQPDDKPGWSYRASWEITGTAPRNQDVCEWCVNAGRGNWKDAAKFCACDECKCHPAPAPRTRTRSYPAPELCCDDLSCQDRAEIQASWYRSNRTAIDRAIRADDAELSTGDDDADPSPADMLRTNELWARYNMTEHGMPNPPYPDVADADPSGNYAEFSIKDVRAYIATLGAGDPCNRTTGHCDGSCPDARDYHNGSSCDGSCAGVREYQRCHCGCCPPAGDSPADRSQRVEWEHTRRGLIGLAEIRTPRPDGSDLLSWVWVAESGDTGREDGPDARSRAVAMAYVALCSSARTLAGELQTIIVARSWGR